MTSETEGRAGAPDKDLDETVRRDGAESHGSAQTGSHASGGRSPFQGTYSDEDAQAFIASAAQDRISELEAENADVNDRMLRLAADMENLRRRTEREIKDARTYAVTGFARDMLAVVDNLRRTIAAVPAEARSDGSFTTLIEGVELTERGLLATLDRFGVKKLEPEGQRFDPNFHQAMFEVPNPEIANNTVVQVVQDGYAIGDRVLRPALVGVSKGGPKASALSAENKSDAAQNGDSA